MAIRQPRPRKKEPDLFINRELSWLAFNYRVLEEAMDPTVPLLDRLKFAIITSTNLDEFFMVRVAGLKNAVQEGDTTPDLAGLTPRQSIRAVLSGMNHASHRHQDMRLGLIVIAMRQHGPHIAKILARQAISEAQHLHARLGVVGFDIAGP